MADDKKKGAAPKSGIVLAHEDAGASFTHSDGTSYTADEKTGLVEVAAEHVADAKTHGFAHPKKEGSK